MGDKIVNHDVDLSKWAVDKPLKDVVWVLMVDEPDGDVVTRPSGIILTTSQTTRGTFRIGKVLKHGPDCEVVEEGDYVLIPPNVGIKGYKSKDGYKTAFYKEGDIMSTITFDGTKDEFIRHVHEDLHATI